MILKDYFAQGRDAIIEDGVIRIIGLTESDLNEKDLKYIEKTYPGYITRKNRIIYSKNPQLHRKRSKINYVKIKHKRMLLETIKN